MLARGTWATLVWLGLVTFGVVSLSAVALALFDVTFSGSGGSSFLEDFWQSLLRVLDPGTMAGDVGWGRRLLALGITLFGLLVAGTLIGVIAAGVEERIESMRRGRSVIFESGHVVVLGASGQLPTLIRQLVLAREGRSSVIVVMADRDAVEMRESVRRVVSDDRGTRLIFRSGDPTNPPDLEMVRLHEAETLIVLSSEDAGDSSAIRTLIAVDSVLGGFEKVPTVVELSDIASAQRLVRVYPTGVHPLVIKQAIGRISAVALREPGIGQVAVALLDDRGSDVHICAAPSLENRPFAEILEAYSAARPIGYIGPDGAAVLNPSPEARLEPGYRLVVVSESAHLVPDLDLFAAARQPPERDFSLRLEQHEQHLLVLGWSQLGAGLLADWAGVAPSTSTAEIMLDPEIFDGAGAIGDSAAGPTVEVRMTADLEDVARRLESAPLIDTLLVLAPADELGEQQADASTLLSLVALQRILSSIDAPRPRVVVEILDVENVPLVDLGHQDDFVVSDAIGSQLMAQLAEMPERRNIFLQLYDPNGPSLHLVPARDLGLLGITRSIDLFRTAYRAGVLAVGYRSADRGLVLNPPRTETIDLAEGDQVVVIG